MSGFENEAIGVIDTGNDERFDRRRRFIGFSLFRCRSFRRVLETASARLALVGMLASWAVLGMPGMLLAQFDASSGDDMAGTNAIDWQIPAKIGIIVAVALAVGMFSYFIFYPAVLRHGKAWPLTLFGVCCAMTWFTVCLVALAILWDDLVLEDEFGGTTFWREHGGRLGVLAAGIVFAVAWIYLWRSDAPKEENPTELSQ